MTSRMLAIGCGEIKERVVGPAGRRAGGGGGGGGGLGSGRGVERGEGGGGGVEKGEGVGIGEEFEREEEGKDERFHNYILPRVDFDIACLELVYQSRGRPGSEALDSFASRVWGWGD